MISIRLALAGTLAALLMFIAAAGVPPASAASPQEVIRKAESADEIVSYRGIKWTNIYVLGRVIRANYKVVHLNPDKTRIDYFRPAELTGIITITKGDENWRFLPKKGEWERQRWDLDADRVELAVKNYEVKDGGTDNVAGRSVYVFKFSPRKRGSPSQSIWVDKEYFLILRSETRNANGDLTAASAFTEIRFNSGDIKSSVFEISGREASNSPSGKLGFRVIKPSYVPKGYQLVDVNSINIGNDPAAHLKYSNGLNTLSIFERKGGAGPKEAQKFLKLLPRGVRMRTFNHNGIAFTIIGDIDKRELDKIIKSIR